MLQTQTMCRPSSQRNTTKTKSSKANFVTWTFRLSPKRQLSILFNVFFPFIDIKYFLSSLKLWHCRTIVLLNKFKLVKKTYFSKVTMVMQFPAKKKAGCPKPLRDFPPRKDDVLLLLSGCLWTTLPPLYVLTDGRWRQSQNFSHR